MRGRWRVWRSWSNLLKPNLWDHDMPEDPCDRIQPMRILFSALLLGVSLLPAQTKKIVLFNPGANQVHDFQAVSSKVKIVPANSGDVLQEIADADGFIGVITPQMYAAAKRLKWVGVMSAGVENIL